jgi:hypothetical protein
MTAGWYALFAASRSPKSPVLVVLGALVIIGMGVGGLIRGGEFWRRRRDDDEDVLNSSLNPGGAASPRPFRSQNRGGDVRRCLPLSARGPADQVSAECFVGRRKNTTDFCIANGRGRA